MKYLELTKEAHILSFNDDTTNRDTGGNLIARRDPNVDRDGWQPHSPACPRSRKGSKVVTGDLVIPGSPKISGVSSMLTTPAPLCSSDKQPLNNRQSVEASCAPRKPPDDLCTPHTQSSEIPDFLVSTKPVSLPWLPGFMGRYLWLPRMGPQAAQIIPIIQDILLIDRLPAKGRGDSFCPTPPKRAAKKRARKGTLTLRGLLVPGGEGACVACDACVRRARRCLCRRSLRSTPFA